MKVTQDDQESSPDKGQEKTQESTEAMNPSDTGKGEPAAEATPVTEYALKLRALREREGEEMRDVDPAALIIAALRRPVASIQEPIVTYGAPLSERTQCLDMDV